MARQEINLGLAPEESPSGQGGEGGDSARAAFTKVNEMTAELYAAGVAQDARIDELFNRSDELELSAESLSARADDLESRADSLADGKVDKSPGKGLSANDFTDALYEKLSTIEGSKFQGLFVSLAALQLAVPVGEPGWYAHIDPGTGGEDTALAIWDQDDAQWILHESSGSMTPAQILAALLANPDVNVLTDGELEKLAGVQPEATKNASDANLRDRSTHTGTQLAATISDLASAIRGTLLTGLGAGANEAIAATDSLLSALAKLQAQIDESVGGGEGLPLFSVVWWPSRAAIPDGYGAADGQELLRAIYPDAWAGVQAGNVPAAADTVWLNTPTERGKYTTGDGASTFRLPDYNGKASGSLGALFLRGDGTLSAGVAGAIQMDAFQGHLMAAPVDSTGFDTRFASGGDRAFAGAGGNLAGRTTTGAPVTDGSNGVPRTANETRPLNVTGCWIIKLFGAVVNEGSADAAQLASGYANLISRVVALETGKLDKADKRNCTAWVSFDGTGTVTIHDSYNVNSITDNGVGLYTINFSVPMDNANYAMAGMAGPAGNTSTVQIKTTPTTTSVQIEVRAHSSSSVAPVDAPNVHVLFFGGKA